MSFFMWIAFSVGIAVIGDLAGRQYQTAARPAQCRSARRSWRTRNGWPKT